MAALSRAAMLATLGLVVVMLSPAAMSSRISRATADDVQLPKGLSYDFHAESCPNLEIMVRTAVEDAIKIDAGVVPGLLRVMFHDCFPQGCDASLLLTGANSEQKLPQNGGLRQSALDLIEKIRTTVHAACGATVSCADITNLATKQVVMQSGLPGYEVPLGRYDSYSPATEEQVGILPGPDDDVSKLLETFEARGFDKTDLVALSGAHTVGQASCGSFKNRKGENEEFVYRIQGLCARIPDRMQALDVTTPDTFDNEYFNNLRENKGVLNSDMALTSDSSTRNIVNGFARDQEWFFSQFSNSMRKMAHLDFSNITLGEIRTNCFKRNTGTVDLAASA